MECFCGMRKCEFVSNLYFYAAVVSIGALLIGVERVLEHHHFDPSSMVLGVGIGVGLMVLASWDWKVPFPPTD